LKPKANGEVVQRSNDRKRKRIPMGIDGIGFQLIGGAAKPDPETVARIKGWVAERFGLREDMGIMVSELRCREEGCPDVETVIGLFGAAGQSQKFKLGKPVAEIAHADIAVLMIEARLMEPTGKV